MKLGQALVGQMMKQSANPVPPQPGWGQRMHDFWLGPDRPLRPEINWNTVQRYGLGGLAVGGGLAATLNLVRMLREKQEEKATAMEPSDTEANTIVLTLPRKTAQLITSVKPKTAVKATGPKNGYYTGPGNQTRHPTGKIGPTTIKGAQEGWQTYTGSMLAGGLGVGMGAAVVNKLYEMRRAKELKDKVEAAKQQYLDKLQGKMAEDFLHEYMTKDARDEKSTFNYTGIPGGLAALAFVLTAGGGGYLVKRMLDEKFRQAKQEGLDLPKVKRIIFKSAPATLAEGETEAPITPEEQQAVKTSFHAMRQALSGNAEALNDPKVKEAAALIGLDIGEMQKIAQGAAGPLSPRQQRMQQQLGEFAGRADVRKDFGEEGTSQYLQSKGLPQGISNFVAPWAASTDYGRRKIDEHMAGLQQQAGNKITNMFGQQPAGAPAQSPQFKGPNGPGFKVPEGMYEVAPGRYKGAWTPEEVKRMDTIRRGAAARQANQPHQPGIVAQEQYNEAHPSYNWGNWLQGGKGGWGNRLMGWWNILRQWFQKFGPQMWQQKQGEEYFRKYAEGIGLPMDMISNLVAGNMIVEGAKPDMANAIAQAQLKLEEAKRRKQKPASTVRSVKLEAADPAAAAYLEQNKAKILKVMQDMATSGKL